MSHENSASNSQLPLDENNENLPDWIREQLKHYRENPDLYSAIQDARDKAFGTAPQVIPREPPDKPKGYLLYCRHHGFIGHFSMHSPKLGEAMEKHGRTNGPHDLYNEIDYT